MDFFCHNQFFLLLLRVYCVTVVLFYSHILGLIVPSAEILPFLSFVSWVRMGLGVFK